MEEKDAFAGYPAYNGELVENEPAQILSGTLNNNAPRANNKRYFNVRGNTSEEIPNTEVPKFRKRVFNRDNGLSNQKNKNLQVMFFGGVGGKIGDNITALRYGDEILVIDCGVGFAGPEMPGVDLVIPDMTWLKQHKEMIKGICVTHAHEDHIGSMPYFLDDVKAPVYGSRFTIAMIENKLREFPNIKMKGITVAPGNVVKIGCFMVEFIHVNHSIPGAFALSITTPVGVVFDSGDFKIDFTPPGEETTDLQRLGEIGRKGVLLMLCESTNIERPGLTLSEKVVGETLDTIFEENIGKRMIITSFVSNVYRVQQIMDLARKYNRKVAFSGRSMISVADLAMKIGEIKFDHKQIIDIDKVRNYKDNEILILATGSQGQEHTALDRMVNDELANIGIEIGDNDTVVFSSSPVPGNERSVTNIINSLMAKGANVIYDDLSDVHASGHACQTEFMILHKLIKPRYFVPNHGEEKHLLYHEKFAYKMGMKPQNVIVPKMGSVIEVNKNYFKANEELLPAGFKMVDGKTICDMDSNVIKERLQLAEDGVCIVVMTINKKNGTVTRGPELIPRGFAYYSEMGYLVDESKKALNQSLSDPEILKDDWNSIKAIIRKTLTTLFFKKTKRRPVIIPILIED